MMNKISLLLSLIFVALNFQVQAQESLEVIGGPNLSGVRYDDGILKDGNAKIGFTAGVGATFSLRKTNQLLHLQLLYERKGAYYSANGYRLIGGGDPAIDQPGSITYRYNYLTIPVSYGFEIGRRVHWRFSGGPYASVLLNAVYYDSNAPSDKIQIDRNAIDVGLSASVACYIPLWAQSELKIGLQDNFGLTNITDDGGKNNCLNLQIGYCLKLKDKFLD